MTRQEMAKIKKNKMDEKAANSQEVNIARLFRELVQLGEDEAMASEQYRILRAAVNRKDTLNFNGVLGPYSGSNKTRALTLVFRLVSNSSIHTLLLRRNSIDGISLGASLQNILASDGDFQLSNLKVLDLTSNDIGSNVRELSSTSLSQNSKLEMGRGLKRSIWKLLRKRKIPISEEAEEGLGRFFEGRVSSEVQGNSFGSVADAIRAGVFPALSSLLLSKNPMSPEDMGQLAGCFDYLPKLERLQLRSMSSKAIVSLMSKWKGKSISQLQELDLSKCDLHGHGVTALTQMEGANIRKLTLRNAGIMADDYITIAEAIQNGKLGLLQTIDLSSNDIRCAGLCALARCLCNGFLPSLRELSLSHAGIGGDGICELAQAIKSGCLRSLEKLDLSGNTMASHSMVSLALSLGSRNATQLRELRLSNTQLEQNAAFLLNRAIRLGNLPHLQRLDLSGNLGLTGISMELFIASMHMGHMTPLKELRLSNTGLQDVDVLKLAEALQMGNLQALEQLDLSQNGDLTDRSTTTLATSFQAGHAVHLRDLLLSRIGLQNEAAVRLAEALSIGNLETLETLDLSGNTGLTSRSIMPFANGFKSGKARRLRVLCLSNTGVCDDAVVKLAEAIRVGSLQSLELLDVSQSMRLTSKSLVMLVASFHTGHMIHLKKLHLSDIQLRDQAILKLAETMGSGSIPALERLDLSFNMGLTSKSMVLLAASFNSRQVFNLRELCLCDTGLQDDVVLCFAGAVNSGSLQTLEKLDLSGNPQLTSKSMVPLASSFQTGHMIHLTALNLSCTGLGDDTVVELAEGMTLGSLRALEWLDICQNPKLTSRSMVLLATSLHTWHLTRLKELKMSDTGLQDDAVVILAEAMRLGKISALEKLDLSDNDKLTARSMVPLLASFSTGQVMHLKELQMSNAGLQDDAVMKLAKSIRLGDLQALERLDLSFNAKLTSKSMVCLATSFHRGHTIHLRWLDLSGTELNDETVVKLSEVMSSGKLPSLESLDIVHKGVWTYNTLLLLTASLNTSSMSHLKNVFAHDGVDYNVERLDARSLDNVTLHTRVQRDLLSTWQIVYTGPLMWEGGDLTFLEYSPEAKQASTKEEELAAPKRETKSTGIEVDWSAELDEKSLNLNSGSESDSMTGGKAQSFLKYSGETMVRMTKSLGDEGHEGDEENKGVQVWMPEVNAETFAKDKGSGGQLSLVSETEKVGPTSLEKGVTDKYALWELTHAARVPLKVEASEAEQEGKNEDKVVEQAPGPQASTHGALQLRADAQRAGFSWEQGFNPGQILILCDVATSNEEASFLFFHAEGMASIFGVGISHSKVSFGMHTKEAIIEEMSEACWRHFWLSSYRGHFKLVLLETSGMEEVPRTFENVHLSKDEALSRFGISTDSPQVLEFVRINEATLQHIEGGTNLLPRLMGLVKLLIDVVGSGAEVQQNRLGMPQLESLQSVSQLSQPNVADAADNGEREASLVVVVIFLAVACPFYKSGLDEQVERVESVGHLKTLSSIRPRLIVEFCRDMQGNYVTAELRGEFQIRSQKAPVPARWNQDDLKLSFEPSEGETGECYLDTTQIKSEVESIQIETMLQSGGSRSIQSDTNGQGSVAVLGAGIQLNKKHEVSRQSNENHQRKSTLRMTVLAGIPFFGIANNSVGVKMEYCASYLDSMAMEGSRTQSDAKGPGLRSNVDMAIQGKYYLYGDNINTYEFQAEKRLFRHLDPVKSWVDDENQACSWGYDAGNVGSRGETLWQIFSRRFLLNHNFSQFFTAYRRHDPYHWQLLDRGSQESPVRIALSVLE